MIYAAASRFPQRFGRRLHPPTHLGMPMRATRRRRRLLPVSVDRPVANRAVKAISETLASAFEQIGRSVADRLHDEVNELSAATDNRRLRYFHVDPDRIIREVDIGDALDGAAPAIDANLLIVASDSAKLAFDRLDIDDANLARAADLAAVDFAHQRAAEMVGRKWDDAGNLVQNDNAKYAIDSTTRDLIKNEIERGFADHLTVDQISKAIQNSTGLSADRAELIARTEVSSINNASALAAYRVARDDGMKLKKAWYLGDNPCSTCEENADVGEIDLDDDFPSGDDAPPAHCNCECMVEAVTDESDQETDTDESDEE